MPIDPSNSLAQPLDTISEPPGRRPVTRLRAHVDPPHVWLGTRLEGGLAPAVMAIVERGVRRRPGLAGSVRAEIELTFDDGFPPVRIVFAEGLVLVEDGSARDPNLRVQGSLPDLISLMAAPLLAGVPSPMDGRGRAALGMVAIGRVRVRGRIGLMRRLLAVVRV